MPAEAVTADVVIDALEAVGITHVVTVPDTSQKTVLDRLDGPDAPRLLRASTEDDVLGICAGLWMAGQRPMALVQQLGLFASVNALRAFTHDQQAPLAILASLYGRELDREPRHSGASAVRLCMPLLDALEVDWELVEGPGEQSAIEPGLRRAFDDHCTSVVLLGAPTQ